MFVYPQSGELRGFTLVEMLVVIAIIGLLVGISVPVLSNAGRAAKHTACAANLHGVGIAFHAYLSQSGGVMPHAATLPSLGISDHPSIAKVLRRDLENTNALLCPAEPNAVGERYFDTEGSSYEYNTRLGGRTVEQTFLSKRFGTTNVFVMFDYESFHGDDGRPGSRNYLFADGHVGDLGSGG